MLRENKQKKVIAAPTPKKKVGPLDSNSVAARRLAAKRGVSSANGDFSSGVGEAAAGFHAEFDSFAPSPETHIESHSSANEGHSAQFAAFGDEGSKSLFDADVDFISPATNKIADASSLFDDDPDDFAPHHTTTTASAEPFHSSSAIADFHASDASTDPFSSEPHPTVFSTSAPKETSAFEPTLGGGNGFDAFAPTSSHNDNDGFSPTGEERRMFV